MSYDLPKPSIPALLIQSGVMLGFAICLYLFGTAVQTNNQYSTALKQLEERKIQLNRAYKQVDKYMIFIDTNPYYQKSLGEPQWEKVDETWIGLPYNDLLKRFSSLYRDDRPFILDYFSATLTKDDDQPVDQTSGKSEGNAEQKATKLIFHLQGYYLCPCQ